MVSLPPPSQRGRRLAFVLPEHSFTRRLTREPRGTRSGLKPHTHPALPLVLRKRPKGIVSNQDARVISHFLGCPPPPTWDVAEWESGSGAGQPYAGSTGMWQPRGCWKSLRLKPQRITAVGKGGGSPILEPRPSQGVTASFKGHFPHRLVREITSRTLYLPSAKGNRCRRLLVLSTSEFLSPSPFHSSLFQCFFIRATVPNQLLTVTETSLFVTVFIPYTILCDMLGSHGCS